MSACVLYKIRRFALVFLCMTLGVVASFAQTTLFQQTLQKCSVGPTRNYDNSFGDVFETLTFNAGDFPANHSIVEVIVEVNWSKTGDGSCVGAAPTTNHEEVGFVLNAIGLGDRYIAASNLFKGFISPIATYSTFTGSNDVLNYTSVFRDNGFNVEANGSVIPSSGGIDTIRPNTGILDFYEGLSPVGTWQLKVIDDSPAFPTTSSICVHSFCVTLVTCENTSINAQCQATPTVALDETGFVTFDFIDLDNGSDVSCNVNSISFSPSTANCSNIGTPLPVTMTIQDSLGNVDACISNVNVVDTLAPDITICDPAVPFPSNIWDSFYIDATGRDTLFATSIPVTDNCGPITTQVKPFVGGAYSGFLEFTCAELGARYVSVQSTDFYGNTTTCLVQVEIIDIDPPTALCGVDTAFIGAGPVVISPIAGQLDAGSSDLCGFISNRWINSVNGVNPTYDCSDIGNDTVLLIVSDVAGNLDTCNNAIITVRDTTAPNAICQNVSLVLNAGGNATLLPNQVDNGSSDICGVDSIDINGLPSISYDCSNVNASETVRLRVFDGSGNVDSCNATITILDQTPPTAICRNFTVYTDVNGNAFLLADSLNNNSIDLCTGTFLDFQVAGSDTVFYDCTNVGASNPVTLTVLDSFSNSGVCAATVTVLDTFTPTAICNSPTVYLDVAGNASVSAAQLSAGSFDNCSIIDSFVNVLGVGSANFNCSAIFTPQPATLIVRDASGNQNVCATTVNVVDTISPNALCLATYTANIGVSGQVLVDAVDVDNGSNDNCTIVEYLINGQPSQLYTCSDIGPSINAVLTVRDSSGQTDNCVVAVTIVDNIPPTVSCQTSTFNLTATGDVIVSPNDILVTPATADNCGSFTAVFSGGDPTRTYTCDSIGSRTVNIIVSDASGNSSSCQTTININDNISPTALCKPYNVFLDANGEGFVVPMNVNNGSFDICGIDTMLVNNTDTLFFNCSNIGTAGVTLSVIDGSGNPGFCVSPVTISDPILPEANCKDTTVYLDATGVVSVFPNMINDNSSDNCTGSLSLSINGLPSFTYDCDDVGNISALLTVTDAVGNNDFCNSTITIIDTFAPTAICDALGTVNVYLDASCFANVQASVFNNGSVDNCASNLIYTVGGFSTVSFSNANIASSPNPITLQVCDGSNNCSTCTTDATVLDTIKPIMLCRPDTVQLDAGGTALVLPSYINNASSDNCTSPLNLSINGSAFLNFTCANIGSNNVTLIGSDQSGNTDSCQTTVFVQDLVSPNANCNTTYTLNLDPFTSIGTLTTGVIDAGSSDNCSISSLSLSKTIFDCSDAGNTETITLYVTDQSGNVDSCTSDVTIQDTQDPVANCVASVNLSLVTNTVSTTAAAINNGSTDNCAIQSISLSQTVFTCADIGTNLVTLTVTDSSGNQATCNSNVFVTDVTSPTATCNTITAFVDATGIVKVAATDLALPGSSDNCSLDTILANGLDSVTFDCADIGIPQNVNIFVQDESNNDNTCTATVNVEDGVDPVASCVITPINLFLDLNGVATLQATDVDSSSSDNCSIASLSISNDSFYCSNVAIPNTVTLIVTDLSGNTSSCSSTINVFDTMAPVMICNDTTVCLSGGFVSVDAIAIDGGTVDNCALSVVQTINGFNNVLYTCDSIGTRTAVLRRQDVYGNIATCNATITVVDCVNPTAICQPLAYSATIGTSGFVSVQAIDLDFGSFDDCGIDSSTFLINGFDSLVFSCANIGTTTTVTLSVFDISGNQSTCTGSIDVVDIEDPVARCGGPINVVLSGLTGTVPVSAFNINSIATPSSDNCTIASYLINGVPVDTFDCSQIGSNTAILTVIDNYGNQDTCHAVVNVSDNTPPTATCQFNNTVNLDAAGVATINASSLVITTSDNCGVDSILANGQETLSFDCSDINSSIPVQVQIIDNSSNVFFCNAFVNVIDPVPPVAICPTTPVQAYLNATSQAFVNAQQLDSASYDNCGIETFLINGAPTALFNCNQIGQFPTAQLTVVDSNGVTDVCTATIEVIDTISPVAICSSFTVSLGLDGTATITSSAIDNGSYDNCSNISLLINNGLSVSFDCSNVNTVNLVSLTVTDNYNNQSICVDTVYVIDQVAPDISCSGAPVNFYLNGLGTVNVDPEMLATATDSCSIVNWYIDGQQDSVFDCSQVNQTHQVVITVEDGSGNIDQCNAFLNVVDTILPDMNNACLPSLNVLLDSSGTVVLTGSDIVFFPSDNCGITDTLINGANSLTYTCDSVMASPLTAVLTLIDASNNMASCTTQINLQDGVAPAALCKDTITVQLDANGDATVQAIALNDGSYDACSPLSYTINNTSSQVYTCNDINLFPTAILTVQDANGLSSTCTSIIEVLDLMPPIPICNDVDFYITGTTFNLNVNALNGGSDDNCGVQSVTFNDGTTVKTFDCTNAGKYNITIVVTDFSGNVDSCTSSVTIRDTTPPAISCNQVTVDLTSVGQVVLQVQTLGALNAGSANDNCALDTIFVFPDTISCLDIGKVPFTVTAIDANGNTSYCYDTALVSLDAPLINQPTQDTVMCEGEMLPLSATMPSNGFLYNYGWEGPQGPVSGQQVLRDTVASVTAADEGYFIFTITRTTGIGCPAKDSIYLDVNEVQIPDLVGIQPCIGDTGIIYLANDSTYIGTTITYDWFFNGAPISNPSDTLVIPDMTLADSGNYSMTITVELAPTVCSNSSVLGLDFDYNDLPPAPVPSYNNPCEGDTLILYNNAPGNTYSWSGPLSFTSTDSFPQIPDASQLIVGLYELTITDTNSCSNSGSVLVEVKQTPGQPELMYNYPLCIGDILELTDTNNYPNPPIFYYWTDPFGNTDTTNVGQFLINNASAGDYQLSISANGCISYVSDTQAVVYEIVPTGMDDAYYIEFRDSLINIDISANDFPTSNGFIIVLVDSADGGQVVNNNNGTINYVPRSGFFGFDTITYAICDAFCPNSCDTIQVVIEVNAEFECYIPEGISPNGDGVNDVLLINCKHEYPNAVLKVFSRWGTQVYEGAPQGWNGQFNGDDLPDGTYFYFLKLNDTTYTPGKEAGRNGDEYNGFIMIQR